MNGREFHPPHIYRHNSCYFLTASVIRHQKLLDTNAKRNLVRDILRAAVEHYGIRLYAWVILPDHYRLLLKTGDIPVFRFVKRLHGQSAIALNKVDGTPGRKVWYQYWDRFPRSERDFWAYFNYIHVNPIKHGQVKISDGILMIGGKQIEIADGRMPDVHQCLANYASSSYHYYVREYSTGFLTDALLSYPIPDYLGQDDP